MSAVVSPVVIAVLVVVQVSMWQYRVGLAGKGRRRTAALVAAMDAALHVGVLAHVLSDLGRPENVAGYAIGVAAGVYLGSVAVDRTVKDPIEYRVVARGEQTELVDALRRRGWPVTATRASGLQGEVTVLVVALPTGAADRFEAELSALGPDLFWTSSQLRSAQPTMLPLGYVGLSPARRKRPAQSVA